MLLFVHKAGIQKEKKVDSGSSSPIHILLTSFFSDSDLQEILSEGKHIYPHPLLCSMMKI